MLSFRSVIVGCVLAVEMIIHGSPAFAEDWPTYRYDNHRNGVSAETLTLPLHEQWVYSPPAAPTPVWSDPQYGWTEAPKVKFDDAFYTVAVGSTVYFASSVDDQIHAVDAVTGKARWSYFTDGPVRLAPTVYKGRVYAASDDGYVYCLRASDGSLLWKYTSMPSQRRILGSGRMVSLWPIRSGVAVDQDTVYFGVGFARQYGIMLVALRADDGTEVWRNTDASARMDFSPQGYLVLSDSRIIAPSGRAVPKAFDRLTGQYVYSPDTAGVSKGGAAGSYIVSDGRNFMVGTQNTLYGFDQETGKRTSSWTTTKHILVTPTRYYVLKGTDPASYGRVKSNQVTEVLAYDRQIVDQDPKHAAETMKKSVIWRFRKPALVSIIAAGNHIIVGGTNEVDIIDAVTGKEVWKRAVTGCAVGLTVANSRLFVSTDTGNIYGFGLSAPAELPIAQKITNPFPSDTQTASFEQTAQAILTKSGQSQGYCLITGNGSTRLGYEIAKRSDFRVYCCEFDSGAILQKRQAIDAAGLYGIRLVVDQGKPDALPYSDYFANLVIHLATPGQPALTAREALRVVKPYGGVMFAGQVGSAGGATAPLPADTRILWASSGALHSPETLISGTTPWTMLIRGTLPGAGNWTHQNANPGNTASSEDTRIKGQVDLLWYGEPGPGESPDRHLRTVSPLSMNGRIFHQAFNYAKNRHYIICFDAYNGVRYWERDIPDAYRVSVANDSGNMACTENNLFVAAGTKCYRLDIVTGDILATYETPANQEGKSQNWGYIAVDNGILFGSATEKPMSCDMLFALDPASGTLRWVYRGRTINHNTISISDGRVCFAELRPTQQQGLTEGDAAQAKRLGLPADATAKKLDIRTVIALEEATGVKAWERDVDLTNAGQMSLAKDGVLIFGVVATPYGGKKDPNRRVVALAIRDGALLWEKAVGNTSRVLVLGDTLIAQPSAYNLRTGEEKMITDRGRLKPWKMTRTSACGAISASATMLFFREGWSAWFDTVTMRKTAFVGPRPGCWINMVPAGGVVVQTEASSGCMCYHSMQCTLVYAPRANPVAQ